MVSGSSYGGIMTAGKGDRIRSYNRKRWDEGWDRAFGKEQCRHGLLLPCKTCNFARPIRPGRGGICNYLRRGKNES